MSIRMLKLENARILDAGMIFSKTNYCNWSSEPIIKKIGDYFHGWQQIHNLLQLIAHFIFVNQSIVSALIMIVKSRHPSFDPASLLYV